MVMAYKSVSCWQDTGLGCYTSLSQDGSLPSKSAVDTEYTVKELLLAKVPVREAPIVIWLFNDSDLVLQATALSCSMGVLMGRRQSR